MPKIKISQTDLEDIRRQSSEFHKLWEYVMKEYSTASLDVFNRAIDSTYKIVTTIGVIAGFGFTGVNSVTNRYLFLSGEFLFLMAIAIGIYWIKYVHTSNLKSLDSSVDRKSKIFKKRSGVFMKLITDAIQTGSVNSEDLENLQASDNEILSEFNLDEGEKSTEIVATIATILILLLIAGGILLLLSFVDPTINFCK